MNKIETKYYSIAKNKISFYSKIIVTLEYLDIFEINIQIFNFNFSVNWKYIYIYVHIYMLYVTKMRYLKNYK